MRKDLTRRRLIQSTVATLATGIALVVPKGNKTKELMDRALFGSYVQGFPADFNAVRSLEHEIAAELQIVSWFVAWGDDLTTYLSTIGSRVPLIALEPWDGAHLTVTRAEVIAGDQDSYFQSMANKVKSHGRPVYLRPWHETNGNWYPWSMDGTAAQMIQAWQHMYNVMKAVTPLVRFVFCINTYTVGPGLAPSVYYPGSRYVDMLGVDGYCWDKGATSFSDVIGEGYRTLTKLDPSLPIWVCETGCGAGPAKVTWLDGMLRCAAFPRVTGLAYFSQSKEENWLLTSDPSCVAIVKRDLLVRSRPSTALPS